MSEGFDLTLVDPQGLVEVLEREIRTPYTSLSLGGLERCGVENPVLNLLNGIHSQRQGRRALLMDGPAVNGLEVETEGTPLGYVYVESGVASEDSDYGGQYYEALHLRLKRRLEMKDGTIPPSRMIVQVSVGEVEIDSIFRSDREYVGLILPLNASFYALVPTEHFLKEHIKEYARTRRA